MPATARIDSIRWAGDCAACSSPPSFGPNPDCIDNVGVAGRLTRVPHGGRPAAAGSHTRKGAADAPTDDEVEDPPRPRSPTPTCTTWGRSPSTGGSWTRPISSSTSRSPWSTSTTAPASRPTSSPAAGPGRHLPERGRRPAGGTRATRSSSSATPTTRAEARARGIVTSTRPTIGRRERSTTCRPRSPAPRRYVEARSVRSGAALTDPDAARPASSRTEPRRWPRPTLDLLVLGIGVAGLSAAVRAAETHDMQVGVLTKGELPSPPPGGPRAAWPRCCTDDPDSTDLHLADTLAAGAGLCDADAVRVLVDEGPLRVHELIALGAIFDRDADGRARAGPRGRPPLRPGRARRRRRPPAPRSSGRWSTRCSAPSPPSTSTPSPST